MDKHADEFHGEYSPSDEERFERDLEIALELSLQEHTIREYSHMLERTLEGEVKAYSGTPVALVKDHPVAAEIRADVEREEAVYLRREAAQPSPSYDRSKKKVLHRLSQGISWTHCSSDEKCRSRVRTSRLSSPNVAECDVEDIPRYPVGEGALKKVPRNRRPKKNASGEVDSQRHSRQVRGSIGRGHTVHRCSKSSKLPLPLKRVVELPAIPVSQALLRPNSDLQLQAPEQPALPLNQALLHLDSDPQPQPPKEKDCSWSPETYDTEEFLRELELARQKSLQENWAPIGKSDIDPPNLDPSEARDSMERVVSDTYSDLPDITAVCMQPPTKHQQSVNSESNKIDGEEDCGSAVTTGGKPANDVNDWLSHAQRYDPQLVKITKAIKRYLARTAMPDAGPLCKLCTGRCTCGYVTEDYLKEVGMTEAVYKSCDVQILSAESDVDFNISDHLQDSENNMPLPEKEPGMKMELVKRRESKTVAASLNVHRRSCEDATQSGDTDPESDPFVCMERWCPVKEQSSGSEVGANSRAMNGDNAGIPTVIPLKYSGGDKKSSVKAKEADGWTPRKKYGNKKLDTQSWNTVSSVWRPPSEDRLQLPHGSSSSYSMGMLLKTLPSVNITETDDEGCSRSYPHSDFTPETAETWSESGEDWFPDEEKTEKFPHSDFTPETAETWSESGEDWFPDEEKTEKF